MRRNVRLGRAVRDWIRGHGGSVLFTSTNKQLNAPFTCDLGLDWKEQIVFWRRGRAHDMAAIIGAIHEAGHILACPYDPHGVDTAEVDWLGWELLVALQCGITLEEYVSVEGGYGIGKQFRFPDGSEHPYMVLGDVDTAYLGILLKQAVWLSICKGYVSRHREPLILKRTAISEA